MKLSIIYMLNTFEYQDSLINLLSIQQKNSINLIVIDKLGDDKVKEYLNDSITLIDGQNKNFWECINLAFKFINTEYTYITENNILFLNKNVENIIKELNDKDIYIFSKNKESLKYDVNSIVKISFDSYIFKTDLLKKADIVSNVCEYEIITQLLINIIKEDNFCYINNYINSLYSSNLGHKSSYIKSWYTDSITKVYIPFCKKHKLSSYAQKIIYYSIFDKFRRNKNSANKELLIGEERQAFFEAVGKLLKYIDKSIILSVDGFNGKRMINFDFKYLMLYLRDKIESFKVDFDELGIYAVINGDKLYTNSNTIKISAINYRNNKLIIDGYYEYYNVINQPNISIFALINNKKVKVKKINIYSLTKYFSISTAKKYTFQLEIPFNMNKIELLFSIDFNGNSKIMPLRFIKVGSRLTNYYKYSYWKYNNIILTRNKEKIIIKKSNIVYNIWCEILFYLSLIVQSRFSYKFKTIFLRTLYWILKPFYCKKRIWIYFDKLYKAGDNGEYQVEYASNKKDGITHYYVLNKDSYDFERLKEKNIKILKFNSIKHKLMCLYAENIVATHPDIIKFCGFGKKMELAFRNLFNANIICIAHGLTIQKNAEVQNRLYDNTMFYTTSSKYEVNHLLEEVYGYNKNELALTGLARFDKMISNDKKQILITPTWRRSVSGVSNMNAPKGYSDEFKQSTYYKIYNSLINDKKLIEVAKEKGYKIIFLLHPAMSSQIDDYDKNDYVELIQSTSDINYSEILSESSLMVTDYSGVQYDFAYMHKPIVYYHPNLLPPRFEEGALKYETMGFGPICKSHDEIIKMLIKYIKNDCKIEKKYDARINDFFEFNDRHNCERIYNAITKFTNKYK